MYKSLCVLVILLAGFAFTSGSRHADASPVTSISPPIVAKGKLINQTAPIPTTTIFTAAQDGLYRLSLYGTMAKLDPSSQSSWNFEFAWTDDGGSQSNSLIFGLDCCQQQFLSISGFGPGGVTFPFEAKAGTTISYSVIQGGSPDNSAYSLYYTLERLE